MAPPEIFDLAEIRLRRPRAADAAAIFEYASDPVVAHYSDWPVRTAIEPLVQSLHDRAERWNAGTEFNWVITLPDADRAIGGISCHVHGHAAEIGFLLHRAYWGRGFATTAANAIVEWARSMPTIWRVWATCDAENAASVRVLEKAGLEREGVLRRWKVRPNISQEPRDAFIFSLVGSV